MKTTIGVPVYNEARFLQKTLASIDGQADQIIICDNASTDGTEEICCRFAENRPYVNYVRFKKNRGAAASFRRCLDLAETEYFMWVGGHDLLVPGHVEKLKTVLEQDSSLVQAYANALHLDQQYQYSNFHYYDWYYELLNDAVEVRVATIVNLQSESTIFHGLYRKYVLDDYFSDFHKKIAIGNLFIDHVILAYVAMRGKMFLYPNCNYIRIDPRSPQTFFESWKRVIRDIDPDLTDNPKLVPLAVYKGQKAILDIVKNKTGINHKVIESAYHSLYNRWAIFLT